MSRRLTQNTAVIAPFDIPDIETALKAATEQFRELDISTLDGYARARAAPADGVAPGSSAAKSAAAPPGVAEGYREGFERGMSEGRERGIADGLAAAQAAVQPQLLEQMRRLVSIATHLGEPQRGLERPVEEAVITLALEVARWVIGSEISRSRDYLVPLVREAIAKVPIDVGTPTIVLNPADIEIMRTLAPDLEGNGIQLTGDDSIEPGGCLVVADGAEGIAIKDRRWHPRAHKGVCEVDLTLASRWREAMLAMFEGEEA
jgi:flagellar assembly protein FliH